MNHLFFALFTVILSLPIMGCFEQMSDRSCPGFEDRSVLKSWAPYVIGSEVVFGDQVGASLMLRLESISDSEPYSNSGFGKNASLACALTTKYTFEVMGSPHLISLEYIHHEFAEKEVEEEVLRVHAFIQESRDGEDRYNSNFLFYLNPLDRNGYRYERDGVENIYYPSENIAGIDYQDVIDVKKLPGDRRPFNLPEDKLFRITRVVFSRYTGITALEYEDGSLYTLAH